MFCVCSGEGLLIVRGPVGGVGVILGLISSLGSALPPEGCWMVGGSSLEWMQILAGAREPWHVGRSHLNPHVNAVH